MIRHTRHKRCVWVDARAGGFWGYVAGTCYTMLTNYEVGGIDIHVTSMDLPMGKGLSSYVTTVLCLQRLQPCHSVLSAVCIPALVHRSAAVCVLVAKAFSTVYDLKLSARGLMEAAYQGETATPSKCGRMDQVCAMPRWRMFVLCQLTPSGLGDNRLVRTEPL